MELLAYRRAEAVEHAANTRAQQLYRQLEDLCVNTVDEFQVVNATFNQAIELMTQQAGSLERAYQALNASLAAAREKLAAVNESLIGGENK
jgi:hypothetical protein